MQAAAMEAAGRTTAEPGQAGLGGFARVAARRLPPAAAHGLWFARRRAEQLAGRLRRRWHSSLQLRVTCTTLVISAVVVAVLGFFLAQQIAGGLLASERTTALMQASDGLTTAQGQPGMQGGVAPSPSALISLAGTLQAASGPRNVFDVVILTQGADGLRGVIGDQSLSQSLPGALTREVTREQLRARSDVLYYAPTSLVSADGHSRQSALAVGAPVSAHDQLYYLFPLTEQQAALRMVNTALVGAGLALVLLLAVIVSFVTRWVVVPLREGAQAATRLSAGDLGQRMPVRGSDDLAALARSFNDMAASLQDKLRELEELSHVQRQFVSDVSHELRTPLTTIRIAADILFEARKQLDASASRSAEVLQSQLERFEALLADLLEISRYDANVAVLEAESADVCDLARRAAADAEQLAARRGSRIEFRLPPGRCVAEVDRRRIERVLRNLLGNAVEHGEGREVVVTVAGDRDAVAVTVRDRGVGLTLAEQQQVFDRFWRADPARTRKTGGTGLGLAIAMEDTRLHGGWLQAWGERGKGSVFRLTVPRGCGQELAGSPLPLGPDEAEPEAVLSLAGDDALPAAGHPGVPGAAGAAAGVVRIGRVNGLGAAGQAAQPAPKATAGPAPGPGADAHG
ncbi:MAG TPA: MtrAB system histidine kinase MtrB [Streptosporangiaceae bacterium]|nr:MtrAB system histidine kinase MtrB [Streptosporangiaceae bacterium]